jgi:hypothetical protein
VHRGRAQEYGAKPTIVNTSTGHPNVRTPLHSRPDPRVSVQATSDIDICGITVSRWVTGHPSACDDRRPDVAWLNQPRP